MLKLGKNEFWVEHIVLTRENYGFAVYGYFSIDFLISGFLYLFSIATPPTTKSKGSSFLFNNVYLLILEIFEDNFPFYFIKSDI